jgi:hypothetical protein
MISGLESHDRMGELDYECDLCDRPSGPEELSVAPGRSRNPKGIFLSHKWRLHFPDVRRLDFQNVPILGPDIKAAAYTAVGSDRLGSPDSRLTHSRFGFEDLEDTLKPVSPSIP